MIKLQHAVFCGCRHPDIDDITTIAKQPLDANERDVLWAHGIIVGSTENFGYMSGQIKDFFERIYYPCLEKTEGLPLGLFIKAGLDGQGATTSIERIVTGLKWRLIQPPLIMKGDFCEEFEDKCNELGMAMAAGLEAGIY